MAIATKPEQIAFKQIDQGVFPARCYSVIALGTQINRISGKKQKKIRVTWEFPTELAVFKEENGEQTFVLSKEYTLSLFDGSNLRKDLETWLGRSLTPEEDACGFDTDTLIGKPCQIQVIHTPGKQDPTKDYANINGILSLPKWMVCPPQVNDTVLINEEDWGSKEYEALPDHIKKKIVESEEWKQSQWAEEFK